MKTITKIKQLMLVVLFFIFIGTGSIFSHTYSGPYDLTLPQMVSTTPQNGATNVPLNTSIQLRYNENIVLVNSSLIKINGAIVLATFEGQYLTLFPSNLVYSTSYTVSIGAGALTDTYGNPTPYSSSFTFTTVAPPVEPILSLLFSAANIHFETSVGVSSTQSIMLTGANIPQNSLILSLTSEITGSGASQFSVQSISTQNLISLLLGVGSSIQVTCTPTLSGTHTATLTLTLQLLGKNPIMASIDLSGTAPPIITGLVSPSSEKQIISEEVYTLSGTRVSKANQAGVYIKRINYSDGTTNTYKFIKIQDNSLE